MTSQTFRAFTELKFAALANPGPDVAIPPSKGRNGYIKTVGVELWANTHDNILKMSPITSRGEVSDAAYIGLPFEKNALLELSAAFAELAKTAPEHK